MGKTLYLDCATGISADMVAGALLDLGADEEGLRQALSSLHVDGFELRVTRKAAGAIDACDFDVVLDEAHDGHDHDMAYLYGDLDGEDERAHHAHHHEHDHAHEHEGEHEHGHEHPHDHAHEHEGGSAHHHHEHDHAHHHEHRTPADIGALIEGAELSERAKAWAKRIFGIVTAAEAKAHGVDEADVLFHEVGAVDSIVDVVAVAYCLDNLDVERGIVSPLAEGEGRVRTAHGVLSVPVPAVANIVSACGLVLARTHRAGEFVTPTGAAIAAAVRTADELPEAYRILACGYGSGKRAYDPPSTVRALLIEEVGQLATPEAPETSHAASARMQAPLPLWKLETEVDDCPGEALGLCLERLLAAGAREAHYVPVYMKKNRPGYQVEVICAQDDIPALERVLFEDTTTIGVRRYPLDRTALVRELGQVATPLGTAAYKRVTLPSGATRSYPEHDSVARLAAEAQVGYQDAYQAVIAALQG